jgi:signal transduction histidine kinase
MPEDIDSEACELCHWEVQALRTLVGSLLHLASSMARPTDSGVRTAVGLIAECEHLVDNFERARQIASRDRDYRRDSFAARSRLAPQAAANIPGSPSSSTRAT